MVGDFCGKRDGPHRPPPRAPGGPDGRAGAGRARGIRIPRTAGPPRDWWCRAGRTHSRAWPADTRTRNPHEQLMKPSLLAFVLAACAGIPAAGPAQVGALSNPTGRPIGGGEGYGSWVDGFVVADRAQLLAALQNARSGAVVYVRDDAVIDLTGAWYIPLNPGVTLASGRGRNGSLGALLYTRELMRADLFGVLGGGVRVTGLRLRGPDTGEYPADCGGNDANGDRRVQPRPCLVAGAHRQQRDV